MRITTILFVLFPLLILQAKSDMTFSNPTQYPTNSVATVTSASNGYVITLSPTSSQPFGHIVSDQLTFSNTPSNFYVTLICTNTAVDFGLQATWDVQNGNRNGAFLGNNVPSSFSDMASLQYPSKLTGTATADPGVPSLGQVIKYTLTTYSQGPCLEIGNIGKEHIISFLCSY